MSRVVFNLLALDRKMMVVARTARASVGNVCDHVLNRGDGRYEVFHKSEDDAAVLKLLKHPPVR